MTPSFGLFVSWRGWRDDRTVRQRAIPDALWLQTVARYPFVEWRPTRQLEALRRLSTLFLARKEFTGAAGFNVTDEIAVAVAVQACLPVLGLKGGLAAYDGFVGIVLHADEVVARRAVTDDDGIVHEYDEALTGEAMEGGPVMLCWHDVAEAGRSARWGYNVVIHEFAHVLDMADGAADGVPALPDRASRQAWLKVLRAGHEQLLAALDAGRQTLLDPYAAESVDEFFAVASEIFFVSPHDLIAEQPALYRLLAGYYRQDPAAYVRP